MSSSKCVSQTKGVSTWIVLRDLQKATVTGWKIAAIGNKINIYTLLSRAHTHTNRTTQEVQASGGEKKTNYRP